MAPAPPLAHYLVLEAVVEDEAAVGLEPGVVWVAVEVGVAAAAEVAVAAIIVSVAIGKLDVLLDALIFQ